MFGRSSWFIVGQVVSRNKDKAKKPEHTKNVISEIESIRKQMLFEDTKEAFESDDPSSISTNIVPGTIKEFLFRLVLSLLT